MTIAAATKPGTETHLAKAYDPRLVESGVYDRWDDAGYFQPRERPDREPLVVVMPPPNVTGELHIGHALFVTVEDIMIRWHRMLGDPTLWIPGADHAGIAGQWVVEKELAKEGLTRHDLGIPVVRIIVPGLENPYGFTTRRPGRRLLQGLV